MPPQATDPKELQTHEARCADAAARDVALTVPLSKPIEHGGTTYTQLDYQPMTGRHLREMPTSGMTIGHLLNIGGSMACIPDGLVDKLPPEDVRNLTDVVNAFLLRIQGIAD